MIAGLSPRGRGNLPGGLSARRPSGSIPAWAGEPLLRRAYRPRSRVYPRVGGGTVATLTIAPVISGLSPRGRGNLRLLLPQGAPLGSIPAWAGEPKMSKTRHPDLRVYPRVGGGTFLQLSLDHLRGGLSPRGRGNHEHDHQQHSGMGSIPAWAGEPVRRNCPPCRIRVYPRVGGGTTGAGGFGGYTGGLSPRGRGNRTLRIWRGGARGSIPAWAGEPEYGCTMAVSLGVYPRVGGGTRSARARRLRAEGLSPRGRGNHAPLEGFHAPTGSIPAWAGEPMMMAPAP